MKKFLLILAASLLLFGFVACRNNPMRDLMDGLDGLGDFITERVMDAIAESFIEYQEFGLIFNADNTTLYYNDEPVVFFEDRRGLSSTTFGNRNGRGLHVVAVRDDNGVLVGLESTVR